MRTIHIECNLVSVKVLPAMIGDNPVLLFDEFGDMLVFGNHRPRIEYVQEDLAFLVKGGVQSRGKSRYLRENSVPKCGDVLDLGLGEAGFNLFSRDVKDANSILENGLHFSSQKKDKKTKKDKETR